jgi:hypothetical protein
MLPENVALPLKRLRRVMADAFCETAARVYSTLSLLCSHLLELGEVLCATRRSVFGPVPLLARVRLRDGQLGYVLHRCNRGLVVQLTWSGALLRVHRGEVLCWSPPFRGGDVVSTPQGELLCILTFDSEVRGWLALSMDGADVRVVHPEQLEDLGRRAHSDPRAARETESMIERSCAAARAAASALDADEQDVAASLALQIGVSALDATRPSRNSDDAGAPGACVVCLDAPSAVAGHFCGHLCLCADCARRVLKPVRNDAASWYMGRCPLCKAHGSFGRIFFS